MHRHRVVPVVLAAAAAALVLALPAGARSDRAAATTRVTVTAGKPSEFKYRLSKTAVKRGTVVFRIVNRGTLPHDFKIGKKKTKMIRPGKAATLRVVFKKAGRYRYLCTVAGHAAAGMKGVLRVR